MNPLFETSLKFPNNVVITKPVSVRERHTNSCRKSLIVQITGNSGIEIPLTSLKAEKFGEVDLKFFGIPIEVRQKGNVLLYGIFSGEYLTENISNQANSELIGIPQYKFAKCRIKSNVEAIISPVFLGSQLTVSDTVLNSNSIA